MTVNGAFIPARYIRCGALLIALGSSADTLALCESGNSDSFNIYWGDLHAHTGYSLDAWGYGTQRSPVDAYAFARGETVNGRSGLERPLDFLAVTDHAEWYDLLYLCTDPGGVEHATCTDLLTKNNPVDGAQLFGKYVLPSITQAQPQRLALCDANPQRCEDAAIAQWKRVQQQANDANVPCEFTTLIGFEWSATPEYSHTHRNVIFSSDQVVPTAIDYIRYPSLEQLWRSLDEGCKAEHGCQAITIPHNTNMGDGKSFDVETESDRLLAYRQRYERLSEIHQEKGNSECLPESPRRTSSDCGFEISLTDHSRPAKADNFDDERWQIMRSSYVRQLLLRGLNAWEARGINPLQLGIIGSTDGHRAAPGDVEDDAWGGSVFGHGDLDRQMQRKVWNPGGLVAALAHENTRDSLFEALRERRVYATSGPRIRLNFAALQADAELSCDTVHAANGAILMGGELTKSTNPSFRIIAFQDRAGLQRIEIIKGSLRQGRLTEQVIDVWTSDALDGASSHCVVWRDPTFNSSEPSFWYARVHQVPTPRWSRVACRDAGRCAEFADSDVDIQERAWSSPIWYLPSTSQ